MFSLLCSLDFVPGIESVFILSASVIGFLTSSDKFIDRE